MDDLLCYKAMPVWNAHTLPAAFQRMHNTQQGTWAQLTVLRGSLTFALMNQGGEETVRDTYTPSQPAPRIAPQQWHRIVSFSPDVECQLAFYCTPEAFYVRKHGLTPAHSEVVEAATRLAAGRALDLGCGRGRNALFLALKGWHVDAWDNSSARLATLREILTHEVVDSVAVAEVDLNAVQIDGKYDLILSTVVMMFLQPRSIPPLIHQMRHATVPGGYNLIVAAMDTADHPSAQLFPFAFGAGELSDYYADCERVKYNEDVGELHRLNEDGERITLRFATLLARRPG